MAGGTVTITLSVEQRQALANLAKVKDSISGMLTGTAAKLTALAGAGGITAFLTKAVFTRSAVEELDTALVTLARNTGISEPYIRSLEKAMTDLGLTSLGAKRSLVTLIANETDLSQAIDLTRVAMDAAAIAQEDVEGTLQAISVALASGQTRMLKHYQLYIDIGAANKAYAASIGKTVDQLTEHDQQQALTNALLTKGATIAGTYAANQGKIGLRWREMKDRMTDLLTAVGGPFQAGLGAVLGVMERVVDRTTEWAKANEKVLEQKLAAWAEDLATKLEAATLWIGRHKDSIILWAEVIAATAIIAKIGGMAKAVIALGQAIRVGGWAAAGAAGPVGIIVAALSALAAVVLYLRQKQAEHNRTVDDLAAQYLILATKTERTREETEKLKEIADKLNEARPGYVEKIDAETKAHTGLADAIRNEGEAQGIVQKLRIIEDLEKEIKRGEELLKSNSLPDLLIKAWVKPGVRWNKKTGIDFVGPEEQIRAEIGTAKARLAALRDELESGAGWSDVGSQFSKTAATIPPPSLPPPPSIAGLTEEQKKAWTSALEALHKLRTDLIEDQFEKEKAQIGQKYAELLATISASGMPADEILSKSREARGDYEAEIKALTKKTAEEKRKADEETAQQSVDILLKELEYKRQLYAWDTRNYIKALEDQLAATDLTDEERKILAKELADAIKNENIELADALRASLEQERSNARRIYDDITNAAVDAALAGKNAWKDFGDWIKNYLIRMVLTDLLDKLYKAAKASKSVGAGGKGGGGGFDWMSLLPLLLLPFGAQHGAYTRRPTMLMTSEHGQAEITSPEPQMRRIVREELAAAGGGGLTLVIEKIQAYDAKSVLESVYDGALGRAIEQAARRGKLNLGTT